MTKQSVVTVLACLTGAASLELPLLSRTLELPRLSRRTALEPPQLSRRTALDLPHLSRRTALAAVVALPAPALAKIDYGDAAPKAESRGYPRLDVNNAVATEFTAFPGLYPTIAGKVCRNAPFSSKAALYEMLDADEKAKLKKFDKYIVVNARSSDVRRAP